MKYIVDLPDAYTSKSALFGDILSIPICLEGGKRYGIPTGIKLGPYTELDEDEIRQKVEQEVWKFVQGLFISQRTNLANYNECYHGKPLYMVITDLTYEEAKARYETWEKQKCEIHVGDEVKFDIGNNNDMKAIALDQTGLNGEWSVLTENGCVEEHDEEDLYKTGKHFDDVDHMLKKMSEDA